MSGGGGNVPSETSSTTQQQLPGWAQPYQRNIAERGYSLSEQPYQQYQGQRVADIAPESQLGLGMATQRAIQGSPEVNASRNMVAQTAAGDYLSPDSNPWLKQTVDRALGDVRTQVNSQFNQGAGGYGGSANQELLTRNLGDTAASMYGGNYQGERLNQLRASQQAPQLAAQDYIDTQALMGVGDVYGQRQQQLLNTQYGDWQQQQQYPYQQLDVLGNALNRSVGNTGTVSSQQSQPVAYNPMAGAIGGGIAGYGLGSAAQNQFGSYSPYVGAALGALGGYNAY